MHIISDIPLHMKQTVNTVHLLQYIAYINRLRESPVGTPKIILGITGLSENLGRDDGIEEP